MASQGRHCDPAFEMLVKVQGSKLDGMTPSERGAINKALKDIKETAPPGTTSEQMAAEIKRRAGAYREEFSEGTICTASALAKHWSKLGSWRKRDEASNQHAPIAEPDFPWREYVNTKLGWSVVVAWSVLSRDSHRNILWQWSKVTKSEQDEFVKEIRELREAQSESEQGQAASAA
jgi:hypothetical protein